jgi:hypothetical protein
VLKIAAQYYGPSCDDLVAAGMEGLWIAIVRFDLQRNNGLRVYAEFWIRKKMREAVKDWRRGGQAGATRADCYAYDNPNATAEEVANKIGCSLRNAEAAIQRQCVGRPEHYSTTENSYDEDGNYIGPRLADSHVMYRMYGSLSRHQLSPHLRRHEVASAHIDALAIAADRRAKRRLSLIGRRRLALELVARDRARTPMNHEIGDFYVRNQKA